MQLEKITAQVRPRPAWEAIDLGFMMIQRWFRTITTSWLAVTLPVFLVINYFYYDRPVLAVLIFWWLLPIFDRIPLHILSRALFGEVPSVKSILKESHRLLLPHIIKSLTLYRLDFARSYNLPVWQLERLSGKARRERADVLKKMQYSPAVGLSLICILIEIIIFTSLFGVVLMFLPEFYAEKMTDLIMDGEGVWWTGPLINLFVYLTFMLVEPFYVAGGFSLYINRRTELEGWDIEIIFRQLARRIQTFAKSAVLVIGFILVFCVAAPFTAVTGYAEEAQVEEVQMEKVQQVDSSLLTAISNKKAKKTIDEIHSSKEFENKEKVGGWYPKNPKAEKEKEKNEDRNWFDIFNLFELGNTLASVGQLVIWMLVAAIIIGAIYLYLRWMPTGGSSSKFRVNRELPKSLFGLEITPESLPDDVGGTAMQLWNAGKVEEALSLLYRAALTTLVHREGINLKGSATEGDCLRILVSQKEKITQSTFEFFRGLTRQWQLTAYAHRQPDNDVMTSLCQSWDQHFGGTS